MALVAGTVSVNPDGSAVSSGLAKAIYDEFVDNYLADTGQTMPAGSASVLIKKGYAVQATRTASAMVSYFTANAQVSTTTSSSVTVTSVSAVTPGIGISGPGVGSASGTGTGTIS